MRRVISIILPTSYKDAEDFAKDCGVEVWHSNTLQHLFNVLNRIGDELMQNHPVQAYNLLDDAQKEIKAKINELGGE